MALQTGWPLARIYVEKPGKKKKRPLGIPNIEDRIVQEATRFILNTIWPTANRNLKKLKKTSDLDHKDP